MQHFKDVKHQDVQIYFTKNQFPELEFLGPHNKTHGVHGLGTHYHMRFDTKLGHGTYEIFRIPSDCTSFTSIIDQPCVTVIT